MRHALGVSLGVLLLSSASGARADGQPARDPGSPDLGYLIARPHTIAVLELGIIALPTAPIGNRQQGGNTPLGSIGKGDATIQTGIHLLYRGSPEWALGAGVLFGPSPTSDDQYGQVGSMPRTHSRSYFWLGGEARYVPLHLKWIEGWVGTTAGTIVIADRFITVAGEDVPAILGTKQVTVRTEGLSLGLQAGADWMFAERFVAGFAFRTDLWLLPQAAQCTPIGDCSTLTGKYLAIEMGLTIGYRIPL